ncbi:hypothetical protein [Kineosporia succinea]|uniref:Uncharacterized protein n=1 Tax=Kineosporia succinea TaxID=84632 RepID=A0ABT9NZG3_9ACTN|nr:hypothetical protein [Kineosporia succinea]MDP9825823.1 hypothetical protein [Kineosporia succinea]
MNNDVLGTVSTTTTSLSPNGSESGTMMSCETCNLVGGPFPAAEAAHLRAIHDRLHHGMLFAA